MGQDSCVSPDHRDNMNMSAAKRQAAIEKLDGRAKIEDDRIVAVRFTETTAGDAAARLLEGLSAVTELTVDDAAWTDQGMKYLEGLSSLRTLHFAAPKVTDRALAVIGKLVSLEDLEVPSRLISPDLTRPWHGLLRLRRLGFAGCTFAQGALAPLSVLPQLKELRLNGCQGVAEALVDLAAFPHLADLNLAVSDVDDAGLAHLRPLPHLTDLDLGHANRLTDVGLTNLHGLSRLRHLDLVGVPVSEQARIQVCEALPDCAVHPLPEPVDRSRKESRCRFALALPRPPLADWAAWLDRARQFWARLELLGGEFDTLEFSVRSAGSAAQLDRQLAALRNPVPESLRSFLVQGAAHLTMRYVWTPDPERLALLHKVYAGKRYFYGGETIGPPSSLVEYQDECREFAEESWLQDFPETQQEWLQAVPFARMPNGDYLALAPHLDQVDPPVIYLCHDDDNWLLARNLPAFLNGWEQLGYVGPEIWMLRDFCDRTSGCLDQESIKAQQMRDVFSNPLRSTTVNQEWLAWNNATVVNLARTIQTERAFDRLPILADALEDAGCHDAAILEHCRGGREHLGGCWVIDLLLERA